MNNWQDFVVLGLIAVAACYLAYLLWCRLTRRTGCDTCRDCPASSEPKDVQDDRQRLPISTSSQSPSNK